MHVSEGEIQVVLCLALNMWVGSFASWGGGRAGRQLTDW